MFSQKIYAEIARLTKDALEEMPGGKAIDQVTIILAYVQLSSRNVVGYDAELKAGIERLLELARAEHRQQLTDRLEALVHEMDRDRAA